MDKKEDKVAEETKESTYQEAVNAADEDDTDSTTATGALGGAVGWLQNLFMNNLHLGKKEKPEKVLKTVDFQGISEYINSDKCCKIITMAGAGISTSAGIPDFRSPGSGLYDNLQKYNLPDPQAIFNIDFFKENPEPFFTLAKELLPGEFKPTPCHYFIKLLHDKGMLLRHYTQNIDTLERLTGLPDEKLVEAHGTFHTSHCLNCDKVFTLEWAKEQVLKDCVPKCIKEDCGGIVKPDIVFFGEALPKRFFECVQTDMQECDLLVIMGTSLVVQPFASLMDRVSDKTPRLYINRDKAMQMDPFMALLMGGGGGFNADKDGNYRDVFWQGDCDAGAQALADLLGWGEELKEVVKTEHARLDKDKTKKTPAAGTK